MMNFLETCFKFSRDEQVKVIIHDTRYHGRGGRGGGGGGGGHTKQYIIQLIFWAIFPTRWYGSCRI